MNVAMKGRDFGKMVGPMVTLKEIISFGNVSIKIFMNYLSTSNI